MSRGFVPQIVRLNGQTYAVCRYAGLRWKVVVVEPFYPAYRVERLKG